VKARYRTARIHPSISAFLRSSGGSPGWKYDSRLPPESARLIHSAIENAPCWSGVLPATGKFRHQNAGWTSATTERLGGTFQSSNGQKWTRSRCVLPDVPQPRNPGVRGLRWRTPYIEMKNRFGLSVPAVQPIAASKDYQTAQHRLRCCLHLMSGSTRTKAARQGQGRAAHLPASTASRNVKLRPIETTAEIGK
jgi:hypothetical protein